MGESGVALCVPFYRNARMLRRQIEEWNKYRGAIQIILVDDGSPEPAEPIVRELASRETREALQVYRIEVDIPWNREGARNLASKVASENWLLHVDIDHVLPAESLEVLLKATVNPRRWYRFRRMRVGKADATRKKDAIDPSCEFGEIKPHIDSYLCRAKHYWDAGGYNEAFSGVLGGGNEFLKRFEKLYPVEVLPGGAFLHVYTRHVIKDASDRHCSRDTKPGKDLWRSIANAGWHPPSEWLKFPWSRVL